MTRSIFDPAGEPPGRSGAGFIGTPASNSSKMPEALTDGVVEEEMAADHEGEVEGLAEAAKESQQSEKTNPDEPTA